MMLLDRLYYMLNRWRYGEYRDVDFGINSGHGIRIVSADECEPPPPELAPLPPEFVWIPPAMPPPMQRMTHETLLRLIDERDALRKRLEAIQKQPTIVVFTGMGTWEIKYAITIGTELIERPKLP